MKKPSNHDNADEFFSWYEEKATVEDEDIGDASRGSSRRFSFFIPLVAITLAATLSLAGYFLFTPPKNSTAQKSMVELAISGIESPKVFESATYMVRYKNTSRTPLTNVILRLHYPDNFSVSQTQPETQNEQKNFWRIGSIEGYAEGTIIVQGKFLELKNDSQSLDAALTFYPIDSQSGYDVSKSFAITIGAPQALIELRGPQKAMPGSPLDYSITIKDTSLLSDPSLILSVSFPKYFTISETNPKFDTENGEWHSETMQKNTVFHVKGTMDKKAVGVEKFSAFILSKANGKTVTLYSSELTTDFSDNNLSLSLTLDSSNKSHSISAGNEIPIKIDYENKGDEAIKNGIIKLLLKGDFFDWTSLKDSSHGIVGTNEITWSVHEYPELALIDPHTKGSLSLRLHTKDLDMIRRVLGDEKDTSAVFIEGSSQFVGAIKEDVVTASTSPIRLTFHSDLSFTEKSSRVASTGDGKMNYKVEWKLENSLHELDALSITATLPESLTWLNQASVKAGMIEYNTEKHEIHWTLNRLPVTVKSIDIEFELSGLPTSDDNKKNAMTLLKDVIITAHDQKTQSIITLTDTLLHPLSQN